MPIKTVRHNLLSLAFNGEFDVIVQGCNCFNRQASGLARQMRLYIPQALAADDLTRRGDAKKLGHFTLARVKLGLNENLIVVNAYTQYYYATHPQYKGGTLFNFVAFDKVLQDLKVIFKGRRFGFPRIGSGLAKADPIEVQALIEKHLGDEDVTIVDYDPMVIYPPVIPPPSVPWR